MKCNQTGNTVHHLLGHEIKTKVDWQLRLLETKKSGLSHLVKLAKKKLSHGTATYVALGGGKLARCRVR